MTAKTASGQSTDLAIIGAGAGGLLAAARAGQAGLRCVLFERKPQPGRKLLMCANNRCNLSQDLPTSEMIAAYGVPVSSFLTPALTAFSPADLRQWLSRHGLKTRVHKDGKVFPESEKSADVVRFFSEQLRNFSIPVIYNAPVASIDRLAEGFGIRTDNFSLNARRVLLATGGVSYPKTGSVGDGQKMARDLGHKLIPYRPGLVGWEISENWLCQLPKGACPGTRVQIYSGGKRIGETTGEIEYSQQGIRGPAIVDASRHLARAGTGPFRLEIDLLPRLSIETLTDVIAKRLSASGGDAVGCLSNWLMPGPLARSFVRQVLKDRQVTPQTLAASLKNWSLTPTKSRPLKEAMVTIGGVSLDQVNPQTMASTLVPGLYFCGEVLDIDGPTGGYNLQAAFSTAALAVAAILKTAPRDQRRPTSGHQRRSRRPKRQRA